MECASGREEEGDPCERAYDVGHEEMEWERRVGPPHWSDIEILTLGKHVRMDTTGTSAPLRSAGQKWRKPLLKDRPQIHCLRFTHHHTDDHVRVAPPYSTQILSLRACNRPHDGSRGPISKTPSVISFGIPTTTFG